MASSGKKKTTMAKLTRESRLRERRQDKQARKDARKQAASGFAEGVADPLADGGADTPQPGDDQAPLAPAAPLHADI